MYKHMIVRTDNVPTELSGEYKVVEGKKEDLEEIIKVLNEYGPSSYYYFIQKTSKKLYNPYKEIYGDESVTVPEEIFEINKKEEKIKGHLMWHNLSQWELNLIESKM